MKTHYLLTLLYFLFAANAANSVQVLPIPKTIPGVDSIRNSGNLDGENCGIIVEKKTREAMLIQDSYMKGFEFIVTQTKGISSKYFSFFNDPKEMAIDFVKCRIRVTKTFAQKVDKHFFELDGIKKNPDSDPYGVKFLSLHVDYARAQADFDGNMQGCYSTYFNSSRLKFISQIKNNDWTCKTITDVRMPARGGYPGMLMETINSKCKCGDRKYKNQPDSKCLSRKHTYNGKSFYEGYLPIGVSNFSTLKTRFTGFAKGSLVLNKDSYKVELGSAEQQNGTSIDFDVGLGTMAHYVEKFLLNFVKEGSKPLPGSRAALYEEMDQIANSLEGYHQKMAVAKNKYSICLGAYTAKLKAKIDLALKNGGNGFLGTNEYTDSGILDLPSDISATDYSKSQEEIKITTGEVGSGNESFSSSGDVSQKVGPTFAQFTNPSISSTIINLGSSVGAKGLQSGGNVSSVVRSNSAFAKAELESGVRNIKVNRQIAETELKTQGAADQIEASSIGSTADNSNYKSGTSSKVGNASTTSLGAGKISSQNLNDFKKGSEKRSEKGYSNKVRSFTSQGSAHRFNTGKGGVKTVQYKGIDSDYSSPESGISPIKVNDDDMKNLKKNISNKKYKSKKSDQLFQRITKAYYRVAYPRFFKVKTSKSSDPASIDDTY